MIEELLASPPIALGAAGGALVLALVGFALWLQARATLRRKLEEAAGTEMRLRDQLLQVRNQAQQTSEQLDRISQTLAAERKAHGDLAAIGERRAALEAQLAETSRTLALRRQELAEIEERLGQKRRELDRQGQELAEAQRRTEAARAELTRVEGELTQTTATLEATRTELAQTEALLAERREELARLEAQIADRRPIAESVSAIESRLKAAAEERIAQLRAASEALLAEAAAVREELRAIPEN